MITTFPLLQPDELLYSAVARMVEIEQMDPMAVSEVGAKLFSRSDGIVDSYFPLRLKTFVGQLHPKIPIGYSELIARHTLFPAVRPFVSNRMWETIEAGECGPGRRTYRASLASLRYGTRNGLWICKKCAVKERDEIGYAYWHRKLQVVPYCTEHSCLAQFCADAGDCWHHGYRTADRATLTGVLTSFAGSGHILAQSALDAQYLLRDNRLFPGPFKSRMALVGRRLSESGLEISELDGDRLRRKISQMRSGERDIINMVWGKGMLAGAVQSACAAGNDSLSVPVVLVACLLLGITVRDLLVSAGSMAGERDLWPCMSHEEPCFSWPTIQRLEFERGLAKMVCPVCGGGYLCKLPLKAGESVEPVIFTDRKADQGPWRTRLLELWFSRNAHVGSIASALGRAKEEVLLAARTAGLPAIPGVPDNCLMEGNFFLLRKRNREVMRQKLASGEVKGSMEFRKMYPRVARWLGSWDAEFTKAIRKDELATKRRRYCTLQPVLSGEEDERIERALAPMVRLVKDRRPIIRATALRLLVAASAERHWLSRQVKNSFPKAMQRAAELEETHTEFLARQVKVAFLELSLQNDAAPDFGLVVARAGLALSWRQVPAKRDAVHLAYVESCAGLPVQTEFALHL